MIVASFEWGILSLSPSVGTPESALAPVFGVPGEEHPQRIAPITIAATRTAMAMFLFSLLKAELLSERPFRYVGNRGVIGLLGCLPGHGSRVSGNHHRLLTDSTLARGDATVKGQLPADVVSENPGNIVDIGSSYISVRQTPFWPAIAPPAFRFARHYTG